MKVTIHYDSKGEIQSVILVNPKAHTSPKSEHGSLEVEMDDVSVAKLSEIHSKYHVDPVHQKLHRR
jgi:hypothetical protein